MDLRKTAVTYVFLVVLMLAALSLGACAPLSSEAYDASGSISQTELKGADPKDASEPDSEPKSGAPEDPPTADDEGDSGEGDNPSEGYESEADPVSPEVINPLTGLPVENPEWLYRRPVMVAISNFPPTAIPHSGESFAAHVFELFQGFGMTRNLVVFFGDYAEQIQSVLDNPLAEGGSNQVIGPVRSGRVVFEDVKTLYPHALLITAGASSDVKAQLSNRVSVYGTDPDDINSTGVAVDQLADFSDLEVDPTEYFGLTFDTKPPEGGSSAPFLRIIYNLFNQLGWEYDPLQGAYLRWHDKADGTGELYPETDRLTGEQLAFENVVVMWAEHRYVTPTVVEMNLVYVRDQKGLLFRDGMFYPIRWSSRSGVFTIHDAEGNPVPLKPGKTFFQVVSYETTWDPKELIVRFHEPAK